MVSDLAVGPRSKFHFVSSVNAREVVPVLRGPHVTHTFLSKSTRRNAAEPRLARDRNSTDSIRTCQATVSTTRQTFDPAVRTAPTISTPQVTRKPCRTAGRKRTAAPRLPRDEHGRSERRCARASDAACSPREPAILERRRVKIGLYFDGALPVRRYGGTERVIVWLARGLLELGHEPVIVARTGTRLSTLPRSRFVGRDDPADAVADNGFPTRPLAAR